MAQITRPTIGFLTANIHIGAARALWPGVLDATQSGNANLICYPGGRLFASEELEAQRNVLYRLIDTERLAGLVSWTSALAGTVTSEEVASFHQRYHPLPVVSLASPLPYSPLVSINDCEGMRTLIFHLVDAHNCRHVALIRGPDGHPYALERYHAYLNALKEKGLTPEPVLITPAVSWEKGADAMRVLLDERQLIPGVDFQAIVAVSDLLAIDALTIMAERGVHVPNDVAVVGFNDTEEGQLVSPPLTSVSLPFYEQGRRSVEVLLAMLAGSNVPSHTNLDSRLLIRQSCGCPSRPVEQAAADTVAPDERESKHALKAAHEHLVEQIVRVAGDKELAAQWAGQLIGTLHQEINTGSNGRFLTVLDGMLQRGVLDNDQVAVWQCVVSATRREILPALDVSTQLRAENLFGQARVMIGEANQRAQIARQLQAEHQSRVLREIGQALITTFDVSKLADVLSERMPELGIESCYLSLYENPASSIEWSRLMLAYTEGNRIDLEATGRRFLSRQLVPADLLPARRYSLVVEPLYFQSEPLGFAVFEIGPRDGASYEVLRGHISSALKGALLFREAYEARCVAERADQIKTRLLANVSHELRTPLNVIIGHAQRLLVASSSDGAKDLEHIQRSAEHQLRIINDLLDLSRAEINALDLYPVILDPKALIEDTFSALAEDAGASGKVIWQLQFSDRLPMIKADPVRLRQILLNLLSNAARFTEHGQITLGAGPTPTHLHVWVADTGIGIPSDLRDRVYEPFFTHEQADQQAHGIGLGLSITRHLVALHGGTLELDSQPGQGSTFHVYLPLPSPSIHPVLATPAAQPTLWLISNAESPPAEITNFSQSRHLEVLQLKSEDDLASMVIGAPPAVVAWDLAGADFSDWQKIHRLHNHPQLSQAPLILYQRAAEGEEAAGLTSLVVKPAGSQALWQAICPAVPQESAGSILIVDDDAQARKLAYDAVRRGFPGYTIRTADSGEAGLATISEDPPSLVILDLMMPGMDGYEVLDRMRAAGRTRRIPVVILTSRQLSLDDVKRLERHAAVTLQSKDILSEDEIIASLHHTLFGTNILPPQTSALVKQAIAFLQHNFARPIARRELADKIGVSEDYLSRMFNRELGISLWDYLNRYRVLRAKKLLHLTDDSIEQISKRVGFSDPAYFSRVFRRVAGTSPSTYRELPDELDS